MAEALGGSGIGSRVLSFKRLAQKRVHMKWAEGQAAY